MPVKHTARNLFVLIAVEGLLVFLYLVRIPSEISASTLLGFSPIRLLTIVAVLSATSAFLWLAWRSHNNSSFLNNLIEKAGRVLSNPRTYSLLIITLVGILVSSYYLFFLAFQISDNLVRVRLERLQPIILWIGLISAQFLVVFQRIKFHQARENRINVNDLKWPWSLALITSVGAIVLVFATKLGLEPDKVGWDNTGAPVLGIQLLAIVIIAVALWALSMIVSNKLNGVSEKCFRISRFANINLLIGLVIWVAAIFLWSSEPLSPTYFSPHPQPPNFEYYPYSDANLHDRAAQNLIIGEGYNTVVEKPLYSLFLGMAHLLAGQDYIKIITIQIVVLAFFPVIVYLLATRFHHRLTGLFAAGFIIVRETNTIALSPLLRVSHSKLLMTDLPAALLMALFVLALFTWLSKNPAELWRAVIAGGALGLTMMVRSQAILLIPVAVIGSFFVNRTTIKSYLIRSAAFAFGVLVVILPWMLRNYQMTGDFGYSQPQQAKYIAKQYSLSPEDDDPGFPAGTTRDEYSALGFQKMFEFTKTYPAIVANFVTAHFIQNEISTLFMFPVNYADVSSNSRGENLFDVDPFVWQDCCSLLSFAESNPYYEGWSGALSSGMIFAGVLNISLISLGVALAWRRWRFLGLLPIAIHFAYSFSVAIARISGWRLILPADWIATIYYFSGLAFVLLWIIEYVFGNKNGLINGTVDELSDNESEPEVRFIFKKPLLAAFAFLIIGISIPLAESVFPQKYEPIAKQEALDLVLSRAPAELDSAQAQAILGDSKMVAFTGRLLYPRYYRAAEEELGGRWEGSAYNYNRLSFYLAGPQEGFVALNLAGPPTAIPNGSDVVLLGCEQTGDVVAYVLVILGEYEDELLISNQFYLEDCK